MIIIKYAIHKKPIFSLKLDVKNVEDTCIVETIGNIELYKTFSESESHSSSSSSDTNSDSENNSTDSDEFDPKSNECHEKENQFEYYGIQHALCGTTLFYPEKIVIIQMIEKTKQNKSNKSAFDLFAKRMKKK